MKKIGFALLAILLICCCFTTPVSAKATLPFNLKAPTNISATWLEENDSPTTMSLSISLDNEIPEYFSKQDEAFYNNTIDEFRASYGFSDIIVQFQIDWALDDVNDSVSGWHYNKYWDAGVNGVGYDEDWNWRVGPWDMVDWGLGNGTETVQTYWVTRHIDEEDLKGNPDTKTPGLKDQLRPDQYTFDGEAVRIDYSKHTIYFRARLMTMLYVEGDDSCEYYFSDWSPICSYGKDASQKTRVTKEDLSAPDITDLHMTDKEFNGNPVVAYTLTVPDKLQQIATSLLSAGDSIYVETYARVKGDAEWIALDGDRDVKPGSLEGKLIYLAKEGETISKDTPIELRCRYCVYQTGDDEPLYSDWSKVISFGTDEIKVDTTPLTEIGADASESDNNATVKKDSCPICHFCPQPLGLCIFIWLIIIVVIAAVIIVIVVLKKKKDKKDNK